MLNSKILLTALLLCLPIPLSALSPTLNFTVKSDWEDANIKDVRAVLESASSVISAYTGSRTLDNIIVRNDERGPISLYKRGPDNEYIVFLDVKGRYWAQMAYQFSHEACHLLSNYDLSPNNVTRQQWFEESICEAFSLFTLKRMAEQWEENPPYPNWQAYSVELQEYADNMLRQKHRSFAPNFTEWYESQRETLEANPYAQERRLNEKVASHLLKIFNDEPNQWAVLNYLNLGEDTDDKSFKKYLDDWYKYTPKQFQKTVANIQQLVEKNTQDTSIEH